MRDKCWIREIEPAKPGSGDKPGTGPTYRNVMVPEGQSFPSLPEVTTLYDSFVRSTRIYADRPALGFRTEENGVVSPYQWLSYAETGQQADALGACLVAAGLKPKGRCGIYGANSPQWMLAMQACNRQSVYCVPLYDSLGENALEYIISHADVTICFVQGQKLGQLQKALTLVDGLVKTVVFWGQADGAAVEATKSLGVNLMSFQEALDLGRSKPCNPVPPAPSDICTIMYTSGTTGDPKGVLLTHKSVLDAGAAVMNAVKEYDITIDENDVVISYLPLAHIFDRVGEELHLHLGCRVGYWRGDLKGLVDDIAALQPTIFTGVPRVFERIYTGVNAKVAEGGRLKSFLYHWGFNRKLYALNAGYRFDQAAPVFDRLVFNKIKSRLGGRVRAILSGGAPLSRQVHDFLRVTMCCPVYQGYGLTETCAGSFVSPDEPAMIGTVGPPLPMIDFRLEAISEMNYDPLGTPPRGEVCIRGSTVFAGYHRQEEKTREVLDPDGWFHTGDVGEILPNGALRIIDRKKNIFKLSQGEYVAVEKLEETYKSVGAVEQVWVYGNSFESTLVAVVVPVEAELTSWAKSAGVQGGFEELCHSQQATQHVLEQLVAAARSSRLKGFEIVKAVHLEPKQFTVDNELLTPTFKLKRPQLLKQYQSTIDAMYRQVNSK